MRREDIHIDHLRLDPDNPRLPPDLHKNPGDILSYLFTATSLTELIDSFLDNGYFEAERLIVRDESDEEDEEFVVVEGNRRLGALMILHGLPAAEGFEGLAIPAGDPLLDSLTNIPCLVLEEGDDVDRYLAYRHIGGLKTWGAEAKARFLSRMVNSAAAAEPETAFQSVARQVGSNAMGVRNSYLSFVSLNFARDELGVDVTHVMFSRFGVWVRCMNNPDIRNHIGIDTPRTYPEVVESVRQMTADETREVIGDLSPDETGSILVADSRDITDYGLILATPTARDALRRFRDFEIARDVVRRQDLPVRVRRAADAVDLLVQEVSPLEHLDAPEELLSGIDRLAGLARTLRTAVRERANLDD